MKAVFSADRSRRYLLRREWGNGAQVTWVMLNPSLAGETDDDPTITRVLGFSKSWNYGSLEVVNLSPTVDPYATVPAHDAENERYIGHAVQRAQLVVVAWGTLGEHGLFYAPVLFVCSKLACAPACLGENKNGSPKHPLYIKGETKWRPWSGWIRYGGAA